MHLCQIQYLKLVPKNFLPLLKMIVFLWLVSFLTHKVFLSHLLQFVLLFLFAHQWQGVIFHLKRQRMSLTTEKEAFFVFTVCCLSYLLSWMPHELQNIFIAQLLWLAILIHQAWLIFIFKARLTRIITTPYLQKYFLSFEN